MKIAGIVCEYNPFHKGHAYQIAKTREILGEDTAVVAVMSGNFVQRGDVAVYDKHTRARAAIQCGADLIVELPIPWVLCSAEKFAYGAVSILNRIGCTHLSFGSECGDASILAKVADIMMSPEFSKAVKEQMSSGKAYPAVCESALKKIVPQLSDILLGANNILGIEYIKAIKRLKSPMEIFAVQRTGEKHDSMAAKSDIVSASYMRSLLLEGKEKEAEALMPPEAVQIFRNKKPTSIYDVEQAIMSRLRMLDESEYRKSDSGDEGVYMRFMKAAKTASNIDELLNAAKTKRYPMARIRRMMLNVVLGIAEKDSYGIPPYIRILAANKKGRMVLNNIGNDSIIITKPASVKEIGGRAEAIFNIEAAAADFYSLAAGLPGGIEWRKSPIMI